MTGSPDERRALELLKNHAELKDKLLSLTMTGDIPILDSHVHAVTRKWFELARLHHADASAADPSINPRSVYSRAYYAAYNASKAVRYVVRGLVSLKGMITRRSQICQTAFRTWISGCRGCRCCTSIDFGQTTTTGQVPPMKTCFHPLSVSVLLETSSKWRSSSCFLTTESAYDKHYWRN